MPPSFPYMKLWFLHYVASIATFVARPTLNVVGIKTGFMTSPIDSSPTSTSLALAVSSALVGRYAILCQSILSNLVSIPPHTRENPFLNISGAKRQEMLAVSFLHTSNAKGPDIFPPCTDMRADSELDRTSDSL
jgi:hypothetical protein